MSTLAMLLAVDQPTGVALPGNAQTLLNNILGWLITLAGASAVGAFIIIGIRLTLGFRRNGQMAADAVGQLGWVFAGGLVVASAAYLANQALVSAG